MFLNLNKGSHHFIGLLFFSFDEFSQLLIAVSFFAKTEISKESIELFLSDVFVELIWVLCLRVTIFKKQSFYFQILLMDTTLFCYF